MATAAIADDIDLSAGLIGAAPFAKQGDDGSDLSTGLIAKPQPSPAPAVKPAAPIDYQHPAGAAGPLPVVPGAPAPLDLQPDVAPKPAGGPATKPAAIPGTQGAAVSGSTAGSIQPAAGAATRAQRSLLNTGSLLKTLNTVNPLLVNMATDVKEGIPAMVHGAEKISEGNPEFGYQPQYGLYAPPEARNAPKNPDLEMRGATQFLGGAMQASAPLALAEGIANPKAARAIAVGILGGTISGEAAKRGAAAIGLNPDAQDFAQALGNVAGGIVAGSAEARYGSPRSYGPEVLPPEQPAPFPAADGAGPSVEIPEQKGLPAPGETAQGPSLQEQLDAVRKQRIDAGDAFVRASAGGDRTLIENAKARHDQLVQREAELAAQIGQGSAAPSTVSAPLAVETAGHPAGTVTGFDHDTGLPIIKRTLALPAPRDGAAPAAPQGYSSPNAELARASSSETQGVGNSGQKLLNDVTAPSAHEMSEDDLAAGLIARPHASTPPAPAARPLQLPAKASEQAAYDPRQFYSALGELLRGIPGATLHNPYLPALDKGVQVALPDGRPGTVVYLDPGMKIARVRTGDGNTITVPQRGLQVIDARSSAAVASSEATQPEALAKGSQVVLHDGRQGTVVYSDPKMKVARVRMPDGNTVTVPQEAIAAHGGSPVQPVANPAAAGDATPRGLTQGTQILLPDGRAGSVESYDGARAIVTTADGERVGGVRSEDLTPIAPLNLKYSNTGSPLEKATEEYTKANAAKLVADYLRENREPDGVVTVANDRVKYMYPEFQRDPVGTEDDVRGSADSLADAVWRTELSRPVDPQRPVVLIETGSPGSGKSTTLESPTSEVGLKREFNMYKIDDARAAVQQVLDSGREPFITLTYVDSPAETVRRMILRATGDGKTKGIGRVAKIPYMAHAYVEIPKVVAQLKREFGDSLRVVSVDNSGKPGEQTVYDDEGIHASANAAKWNEQSVLEEMHAGLERFRGRLSDAAYRRIKER